MKLGLVKKLVFGMVGVAIVTYGTSAVFIFYVSHWFQNVLPQWLFILITLLLGIIWSGILGWLFASYLMKRLQFLQSAVQKAAEGHFDIEVPLTHSRDELETLAIGFNKMIDQLGMVVKDIQQYAGKTSARIEQLNAAADDVSQQIKQISENVNEIATGAESDAKSSQEALNEVKKGLEHAEAIRAHAKHSKQLAESTIKSLSESVLSMKELIDGVHRIGKTNESSLQVVMDLKEQADGISRIIDVVAEIAEKTNMLSLNASIEAARAGVAGKGFTVVAHEIQELANQSAAAVQEIHGMIRTIQEKVDDSVLHNQEQLKMGQEEIQRVKETEKLLSEMADSIYKVMSSINDIDQFSADQQRIMDEIVKVSEQNTQIAHAISAAVQETAASTDIQSHHVTEMASLLTEILNDARTLQAHASQLKVS